MINNSNPRRWVMAVIVYLGAVMLAMIWNAIGPMMLNITDELSVSFAKAGLLSGIVAFVLGIFAFLSGSVSERLGIKNTTCLGMGLMSLGCLLSGYPADFNAVLLGRIIFAIGAGLFFPMLGAVVMQWFEGDELLILNSINFSGTAVGGAVGLAITAPIMGLVGWRDTLVIYGIACGFIAFLAVFFLRDNVSSVTIETESELTDDHNLALGDILQRKETWLLALTFSAPVTISVVMPLFLPAFFVQAKGVSMVIASSWVSTVYLFGIPAAILGGVLGVKAGVRKPFLIANGLMLGCGLLGAVVFDGLLSHICLGLIGIGLLFYTGIFFTIPMELRGMTPHSAGMMIGVITFLGMQFGFTAPMVVGWLEGLTGTLKTGLIFYGLFGFLMAICPIFLEETGPRRRNGLGA
jgi:cyanate permease